MARRWRRCTTSPAATRSCRTHAAAWWRCQVGPGSVSQQLCRCCSTCLQIAPAAAPAAAVQMLAPAGPAAVFFFCTCCSPCLQTAPACCISSWTVLYIVPRHARLQCTNAHVQRVRSASDVLQPPAAATNCCSCRLHGAGLHGLQPDPDRPRSGLPAQGLTLRGAQHLFK